MLIAVMAIFSSGGFAADNNNSVSNTSDIKIKEFPSGSGWVTDCNGDTWEVSWSCNYNCSFTAVNNALAAWYENETGCDPDDYVDSGWDD